MLSGRFSVHLCMLIGLWFLISLGRGQLSGPTAHAQASSAKTAAVRKLFRQHCVKCHGADGKGRPARRLMPNIPDFTKGSWQRRRSDAQLLASILDGKEGDMPAMGRKLDRKQARRLVAYVRAFAPTAKKPRRRTKASASRDKFEERFRRLEERLDKLNRQAHELAGVSPRTPSKPSPSRQRPAPGRTIPTAARAPALRKLFQQHCVKCHGGDGKGRPARRLMPNIPDFTKESWQRRRSDAKLLGSILNGKGDDMPAMRRKLGKKQARRLVAYVRAFAPTAKKQRRLKE
jgi:mono/diheme cytochrome c family protein